MATIKELTDYLHTIAPNHLQEAYDNSGLLVGDPATEIKGVLVSLDCTESIIAEAVERNCNVVVCHHPIIFGGIKRLTGQNYVQRTVIKAIKEDVAILAVHTNLDNVFKNGVNERICKQLHLKDLQILKPKMIDEPAIGAGMVGVLSEEMDEKDFLRYLKEKMEISVIKHTRLLGGKIRKVAVCGGSGGFLLEAAKQVKADIFITSDYKYHEFFDADGEIIIADIGHYESEQYTIDLLFQLIKDKFRTFAAHYTNQNTNPVNYF